MPAPLSLTQIRNINFSFEPSATCSMDADTVTTPPLGVNFKAFDTRLAITRVNLVPSTSIRALAYILLANSYVSTLTNN